MKLTIKYRNGKQFNGFYEDIYLIEAQNEPVYKISVFSNDDGSFDSYITDCQTSYATHKKGFNLPTSVAWVLTQVRETYPETSLFFIEEKEEK